jgi:stage II sporulation protein AA (anti-sigma F factor antagonist)
VPAPLSIAETADDERVVLTLTGDLKADSSQALSDRIAAAIERRRPEIVLELSGLTSIDSSGLGVMIAARGSMQGDARLRLIGARGPVARAFERAGLSGMLNAHPYP